MIGLTYILELENISVNELSAKIDVDISLIYRWIKGTKKIPEKRIAQLAELFPTYGCDYFSKQLDEIDKLRLDNIKIDNQIRNLSIDDPLKLVQERKRLQNAQLKNESLIEQQRVIEDMGVLFGYTYNLNVNSLSDVSVQRLIISHFSDLCIIVKKILADYFENENDAKAFKEKSGDIINDIKQFSADLQKTISYLEKLIRYNNK